MEFRVDFFFRVFMDSIFYATHLTFFTILYGHIDDLAGWNLDQIYIFIAGFFLADAIHMTVFANNMWAFPFVINLGDLDYHLVRPVSTLFFLSVREFAANSVLNIAIAAGIFWWALARYPEPLGTEAVVDYVALVLNGVLILWMAQLLFLLPVFWTHSAVGLRQLFFSLERFATRPHQIFGGWLRRVLLTVLPFSLIASYPATVLFDGPSWTSVLYAFAVSASLFAVIQLIWHRALRAYSSASS
jgi:ABC-2 type transport system permease protein